jgi:hypothetical protein
MDRAYRRALDAIEQELPICEELAKEFGVKLESIKYVRWFILELAERLG